MTASVFISGCYIVKDEADVVAASLEALAPFVDEIVVYDTGSTDDTVAIARAAGARVVEGYWDDDFGAARNRAQEHCRGEWVVCVDADEVAQGDPAGFRRQLRHSPLADVLTVAQVSGTWDGGSESMNVRVSRVLRRATCRWSGALHEHPVGVRGQRLESAESTLELLHSGYTLVRSQEKDKGERNYRVARQELARALEDGDPAISRIRVNFGRSAHLAGRRREALEAYEALDLSTAPFPDAVLGAHAAVEVAIQLDEYEVAERWLGTLEELGEDARVLRWLQAQLCVRRQDWERARELLERSSDAVDLRRVRFRASAAEPLLAVTLFKLGEFDRAADVVVRHLRSGSGEMRARYVVDVFAASGRDFLELVDALPEPMVVPLLGQLHGQPYPVVADFLTALWGRGRSLPAVLLTAASTWPSLTVHEALVWSLRMREHGMAAYCPLRQRFESTAEGLRARIVCGVALAEAGEDVWPALEQLLAQVPEEEAAAVVAEVGEVSPRIAAALQPA